jgi:F420-dependent methylenetetrahydromethanopterin dehydrogenase
MTTAANTQKPAATASTKHTIATLEARIVTLEHHVASLLTAPKASTGARDRGPTSTREMLEADAKACMIGEHKNLSHKDAAKVLGLSYGQIYSARGGYTFKGVAAEAEAIRKAAK